MSSEEQIAAFSAKVRTTAKHSAAAFGNTGVTVVGTPALVGFIETAAAECAAPLLGPGEATVGTMFSVRHLAPAPSGAEVQVQARLHSRKGQQLGFAVEALWGETLLMTGTHERAIVNLGKFLGRIGGASGGKRAE